MKSPRALLEGTRRWSLEQAPSWCVLAASALAGALLALNTFGLDYLLGSGPFWSWPVGDAAMMLTGWSYFVHEPWHWPLGHIGATNGPAGTNILYLDTIPLVAVLGKVGRSVVGGTWHPYGLWHLAIYVLQGVFGACLARALRITSLLGGVGVALLVLSMHAFTLRFYHEGLNGHFVLLWALLAYVRTTAARRAHFLVLEWWGCLACAMSMHPYLGAMTAWIAIAAFVRLATLDRRRALVVTSGVAAALLLVLVAFGYIPQAVPPSPGIFGLASMNLLSVAVPLHSTLLPLPPTIVQDMTGVQWDGNNFLGVGVWLLGLAALLFAWRAARDLARRHLWLLAALVLLALYAPSTHAWLGRTSLWHVELPARWMRYVDNLPATGRFFWPVGYALLIGAATLVHRRFGPWGAAMIAFAGALQIVDDTAARRVVTSAVAAPWKRELDWDAWRAKLAGASQVNIYPSFWCWPGPPPFPEREIQAGREVEYLASANGQRTNAGRAGRHITDCAKEVPERASAAAGQLRDGEVYVFFKPAYTAAVVATVGADRCVDMGDAFVCRSRP